MKKRPPFNVNSIIRGAIRRTFARCPAALSVKNAGRREVAKYNKDGALAKKPAVQYSCQICKDWVSSTKISVDHIEPVISVTDGFVNWDTFIDRLGFEKPENLQRICDECHQKKTNGERFERTLIKDKEILAQMASVIKIGKTPKTGVDWWEIDRVLKKFSKKKLQTYPSEVVEQVLEIRALARLEIKKAA